MNITLFSVITRMTAVANGALAFGWWHMGFTKTAIFMAILGIFDPSWIPDSKAKNAKNNRAKTK